MNNPDPYDRPEEPECDVCDGEGCVCCDWTGTLSEAAQREIAEETKAERKDWRNA